MTFEELKEEANRQGYNLVKKYQSMPKLNRCPICGRLPKVRYDISTIYISCPSRKCLHGPVVDRRAKDGVCLIISKSEAERQAREAWNNMIENGDVTIGDIFDSLPEDEKNRIAYEITKGLEVE